MPKVALSKFAQYDLKAIEVDGFLKFGRFQRDKYTLSLLETLENIGDFPHMGFCYFKAKYPTLRALAASHFLFDKR